MGSVRLNADEATLIENLEAMMREIKAGGTKLSDEERTLMAGLSDAIAALREMDAGGEEEGGEDRLSPEEQLVTRNLLDMVSELRAVRR
jgi:hypothetical protein